MACSKQVIRRWLSFMNCPSACDVVGLKDARWAWLVDLSAPASCDGCGMALIPAIGSRPLLFVEEL